MRLRCSISPTPTPVPSATGEAPARRADRRSRLGVDAYGENGFKLSQSWRDCQTGAHRRPAHIDRVLANFLGWTEVEVALLHAGALDCATGLATGRLRLFPLRRFLRD